MATRFIARQVIYLLGTADANPHQPDLDTSCAAEAQGRYRLARGLSYVADLQARHPGTPEHPGTLAHRIALIPGVGHQGGAMFGPMCGLAALFDRLGGRIL